MKKLFGFLLFLPALMVYFFAAAALGEFVPNNQLLKALYYLVAGIAWSFPSIFYIRWLNSDPKRDTQNDPAKTPF